MKKQPKTILIGCILIFSSLCYAYSQAPKVKFGKVSEEELKMTTYENDTTASAVILYDQGQFNGNTIEFKRHVRIKILKPSGTSWGNWTLNVPYKGSIKGFVYNFENGEISKEKIAKDNIFEEEAVNDYFIYKVFAPNVKVGTVIDITYSHLGVPFEWRFQQQIPVVYSELKLEPSVYIQYSTTHFGFAPIRTVDKNHWIGENMPAFKIEPFISTYGNYITKFRFQIVSLRTVVISTKWEDVNSLLLDHYRFGTIIDNATFVNEFAKETAALDISIEEKIAKAQKYVTQNLKYNGSDYVLGSMNFRRNFSKDHSANSAEINLVLVSLLQRMGINAKPVVLSTRKNGFLLPHMPSIDQLDYVLCYVDEGEYRTLVDATSEDLVPGIVPSKCLNGSGLIVEKNKVAWVPLHQGQASQIDQVVNIEVAEDGSAKATISQRLKDYAFLNWKVKRKEVEDDRKYMQDVNARYPVIEIKDYEVQDEKPDELTCNEVFSVELSEAIIDLGNELLVTPALMPYFPENPFKSPERKYPVDLGYPISYSATIELNLPEKYTIKALPEPVKVVTQGGDVTFTMASEKSNNVAKFTVSMKLGRTVYTEREYLELRDFFSAIIKKMNESVEITKNT